MRRLAYIGFDTPRELVAAAGFTPYRLWGDTPQTTDLPANLSRRAASLVSQILKAENDVAGVVIAHGCAEDVQIFGVLRELARTGRPPPMPVTFVDLLHGAGDAVLTYNRARLDAFKTWLEFLAGREIHDVTLSQQIADANRRRRAVAQAFKGRSQNPPTHKGMQAVELVRQLERVNGEAADRLIAEFEAVCGGARGARLLLTGSAPEHHRLYAQIEAAGLIIVGEDHDGGDLWTEMMADEALPPIAALALRPQTTPHRGPTASSHARAEILRNRVAALQPDAVVHLRIDGDEAAAWDLHAARRAVASLGLPFLSLSAETSHDDIGVKIADWLSASKTAEPPKAPAAAPPRASRASAAPAGRRSQKALACTADFSTWQREWFAQVRSQAEKGPFAVVNADAPQELLRAMSVPFVVNQWWAAIVAAKQKSRDYAAALRAADYPVDAEPYSAQGLAAALVGETEDPPWGGLPTPDFLALVAQSDAGPKLFEAWASTTGAQLQVFERSVECRWDPPISWWDEMPAHWAATLEPERLDLMTAQLQEQAERLSDLTGRGLDLARLVEVMRLINAQEDYYRRTRDLIATTRPAPISVADSMPATMTPQWHRGTPWGRDAARRLFEEVRQRVADGVAACPGERLRLMWVGRGLWGDMGFYQRWEDSHGAVFVWSMYLGLAADGYIREFEGEHDVMRALAARFLTMGDELRMPTWAGAWHVKEALLHGVDGAVAIDDADPLVVEALRRAGIPVCEVALNNMATSGAAAEEQITAFIEGLTPRSNAARD